MKGYLIANVRVEDAEACEPYRQRAQEIIARHGGRYLVGGGEVDVCERQTMEAARGLLRPRRLSDLRPALLDFLEFDSDMAR